MSFRTARMGLCAALVALAGTAVLPATSRAAGGDVTMVSQSAWTPEPGSKATSSFALDLSGPDEATVATTLFSRITTRSAFQATLASTPNGNGIDRTPATPLRCFDPKANGAHRLRITLLNGQPQRLPGSASPQCRSVAPPSWSLPCAAGSCAGVYPVVVVTSAPGLPERRFTTFLTLTAAQPGTKIHAAVVVAVDPGAKQRAASAALVRATRRSGVPATVLYSPAAVTRPSSAPARGNLVAALANARASASTQVLATSFVPVDAGGLEAAGLADELVRQRGRAASAIAAAGLGGDAGADTWVAQGSVTGDLTGALQRIGVAKLVLPDSSFSPPLSATNAWGQPFALSTGVSSTTAMAADAGLAADLAAARSQPTLAAYHLLADLAFLHFEEPYARVPRGAVALDPGGAPLSASFASTLLAGLRGNPVVQAETLRSLFERLSVDNATPPRRRLDLPASSYDPKLAQAITTARARLQSLRGAAKGQPAALLAIGDQLLSAERSTLRPRDRGRAVAQANAAVSGQLRQVAVSSGTITLTSRKGTIPIAITSGLGYPITGTLSFSSDKLVLSSASTRPFTIARSTHAIRVGVTARTTGDLPLEVRLTAPDGLPIASGTITVRSTATSKVGIVITLAAAAVLLLWWLRSLRRRRQGQREP